MLDPLPVLNFVAGSLGSAVHHGYPPPHPGRHMLVTPEHQVVDRALIPEQLDILERPGDAAPGDVMAAQSGDPLAFEVHAARRGPVDPADAVERGRLPGAVGPDQREDRRTLDLEGDIVERGQPAKAHRESLHREEGHSDRPTEVGHLDPPIHGGHLDLPLVVACEESGWPEPEDEDDDQERDNRLELDRDVGAEEVLGHA